MRQIASWRILVHMNYTCPYCSHHSTLGESDMTGSSYRIYTEISNIGRVGFSYFAAVCPNKNCKGLNFSLKLKDINAAGNIGNNVLYSWQLLPESEAKVMPDYLPCQIAEDYYEACKIKLLSPKASATLSRRCLQGMIRDFHGISMKTLFAEINALEKVIPVDVWESIDAVRKIGNIGAHMESDINIIIDVEPDEAQLLISLIEQLVDDWYIVRQDRKLRAEKIKALADSKKPVV